MPGRDLPGAREELDAHLTFVIPVWDRYVPFLENLVRSLADEIPGARFVVVDNASTMTLPTLDDVTVVRLTERRSTGAARNAALSSLSTPFVCFFDADDLPLAGALERLLSLAKSRPDVMATAGISIAWHPATSERIRVDFANGVLALQRHRTLLGLASLLRNRFATVGAVLRTDAVRDAGGFSDLNYCEDWGLSTALAFRGRIQLVSEPIILSRIHVGSMIHREGTPAGIVRTLFPLYRRWLTDGAIPFWLKPLFLLTPIPRLKQAFVRWRRNTRSHDDLFERMGRHGLAD